MLQSIELAHREPGVRGTGLLLLLKPLDVTRLVEVQKCARRRESRVSEATALGALVFIFAEFLHYSAQRAWAAGHKRKRHGS